MKHRRNKVKREHGIIHNALSWLENLSRLSEVTDIIPGVIDVSHSSERGIAYKYETQTGCKLLLKSNGCIQEVFVVTKSPTIVRKWVEKEFSNDQPAGAQVISQSNLKEGPGKRLSNFPSKLKLEANKKPSAALERCNSKKRLSGTVPNYILGNLDVLNVADRLDSSTMKSLSLFKKSLEHAKIQSAKTKDNK